jgi:hypothetical protein
MWWTKSSSRKGQQVSPKNSTKPAAPQALRRKPLMMSLEPRFMFDGAVAATHAEAAHSNADHHVVLDHLRPVAAAQAAAAVAAPSGPAVVFVDSRVTDAADLLKGVAAGTEVVYLQSNQDGLAQIASYLAAHHEVGSVEILAHGTDGDLLLGDTNLTSANINSFAQTLGAIGSNLKQGADILIYSCDTAADAQGVTFVDTLARLTGHNVAASTNVTGAAGDWTLEFTTGDISAVPVLSAAAQAGYVDNLGLDIVSVTGDNANTSGTLRYEINHSSAGDIIYFSGVSTVTMTTGSALSIVHDLTIESDLAGDGSSPVLINANHTSGVMSITGGTVNLIGLTLENGLIAGNGGGYISGNPSGLNGGNALGAGLYVGGNAIVSMNHVIVQNNAATGGGGGGGGVGYSYGGGGGSGISGVNSTGGTGGAYSVTIPGSSPINGVGGLGGNGGTSAQSGFGGSTTGGAGGSATNGFAAGGNGATAGNVGGGGGGAGGSQGAFGGSGGIAVGGMYVGGHAKVYVANSTFSQNYGAGGGGGGNYKSTGGAGGDGAGAIRVGASGSVFYSAVTFTSNKGYAGNGGSSQNGVAGANGSSSGTAGIQTADSGSDTKITSATPTVTSIDLTGSSPNHNSSESFTVTFSENVTGVTASDFTVTTTGNVADTGVTVTPVSGSVYTVTVNGVTGGGTMRLDLNSSGTGIQSAGFNQAISGGYTSGQTYDIPPVVSSVTVPSNGNYSSGQALTFTVNFDEAVTVTGTPEIAVTLDTGGTVQAIYTGGSGSSALTFAYTVVSGEQDATGITVGALTLNGGTIKDGSANSAVLTLNGVPSTAGVDVQAILPTVSSINIAGSSPANGASEAFTVTFSEAVSGVVPGDFAVSTSGTSDTGISSVSTSDNIHYTVTVGGVSGNGTLGLNLNSGTAITDTYGNVISGGHTGDQTYTIDTTPPTISSINRTGTTPNNGSSETFTVTFSESVTGVTTNSFQLADTGSASGTIASVSGSGSTYTVTVSGVAGDGTMGLNLKGSGTGITDLAGNAITGGAFTGQVYTLDHTPPTVTAITALGASPNNANSDQFSVTFSEAVTGVNVADFALTTNGTPLTTGGITSITTSDNIHYTVTVGSVAGDGTLRLDLKTNDSSITDASGNSAVTGFTSGDTYTIEHTPPAIASSVASGTPNPNNASSDQFTVTFTEAVTGVDASDFSATTVSGTVAASGITVVPVNATTYTVTLTGVTGDGVLRLDLNSSGTGITDAAGNAVVGGYTAGDSYTIEHTAPAVTSVAVPASTTYIAGQNLDFTVNFSEAVIVDTTNGTPEIAVTLDTGGTVYAQYVSGSNTSALTFRYTVVSGEADTNGIALDTAITLNGGTLKDVATNDAVLALNGVGTLTGVLVDSIPPTVSSVSAPANATYGAGQTLDFTVNFSENVLVTGGTPYIDLTLDTGGTVHASYVSGSGTNALTFEYTVASGNNDANGVVLGSSIVLNGGAIKDAATNAAVLTLNSVADTTGVLVDAVPPTVTSINIAGTSPNNASSETYTVAFSAPVNGVDATDFTLVGTGTATGSITNVSGSGTTWTVTVTGVTGDGTLRLDLNNAGDPITDNFGNHLTASHTGDQSYTIEHTPPAVTSVTVPGNGTYVSGQDLDFTTTFSEAVTVTGTPRIAIALDTGGTVYADYVSGSGTNTLTFRYTVMAGNQDLTGITTPGSVIDLNGGTIKDAATNATSGAGLNLTGETSLASVDVDAIVPVISSVGVPANGTYGTGAGLDFTVDFTKVVNVTGTPYIQITLDTGGTVDAVYFSGSGSSQLTFRYVVPSGELDTNGIVVGSSIVLNSGTIQDAVGNNTDPTLNSVGSTTGVLVDSILPTVTSIDTVLASTNNLGTETFTVTFSTDVSLSPPDTTDFTLHNTGTIGGTISSVTAVSGSVYTVTVNGVTGDGTMRLDLNTSGHVVTDAFGNQVTAAHTGDQSYTIEHTPPSATAMTVPANGTYGVGQALDFTVTFSEPVTVDTTGGTPRIALTLDTGGTVYATYVSGSGTGTLTFHYVPTAGVQDLTGIVTDTAIEVNGGTIKDAATNNAVLAINAVEPSTAGIDVDAIQPAVTSVGVPANATYIAGQDLDFTVNLNKTVTVDTTGGTPYITLTLDTGGTVDAQYISGSGTSTLTFRYVVANGNLDTNGITLGTTLVLNSGTIVDAHGNAVATALNGEASTTGVLVDAVPPVVSSIAPAGATLTNSATVTYTVTFSEGVTGVDASDFTLTATGATTGTITSVTPVSASVYTVTVSNISGDGTLRLDLNSSGTGIADLATNAITTGYTSGGIYTFDHASAALTGVGVPAPGTYVAGQTLDFTVDYNEAVNVSTGGGTPRIAITLDNGETVYATYVSGSGSNVLTFAYTVAHGDIDSNGITLGGSIDTNGGSMVDSLGNSAGTVLANVGDTSHVLVDGTDPTVASITTTGSGTTNASTLTYTVTFSEGVTGVNTGDFALTGTGSAAGTIASVTAVSGNTYTVTVDNVSGAGTLRLDLNPSSGVADAAGTAVPGFTGGDAYSIDRIQPTVTAVTVPASGLYGPGQTLTFDVNFSQAVTVDTSGGTPSITVTLDSGTVQAHYVSGSGSGTLVFSYTVAAGDKDVNGIVVGSSISANGGSIASADHNAAVLTLVDVGSTASVDVGVSVTPPPPPPPPGGGGRGILPGCGGEESHLVVDPYVWAPTDFDHGQPTGTSPHTEQINWSPVPLLSSGQQGSGQNTASRGSDNNAIGSTGYRQSGTPSVDAAINPPALDLNLNGKVNLEPTQSLNWQAPPELQQHGADTASLDPALIGNVAAGEVAQKLVPSRDAKAVREFKLADARSDMLLHARLAQRATAPLPAVHAVTHAAAPGKASLNQQFTRYGQKAWEREKSVLVDNAQLSAQHRAG